MILFVESLKMFDENPILLNVKIPLFSVRAYQNEKSGV